MIGPKQARDIAESSFKKKEVQLKESEPAFALAEQRQVQEKTLRLRALRLARDARDAETKAAVQNEKRRVR